MSASTGPADELSGWISDLSPHGVLITDHELVVRGWNGWLATHTRRPAAAAVGRPLLELYPDLAERRLDQVYRQALAGQTLVLSQRLHRYLLPMPPLDEYVAHFAHMQQSAQVAPIRRGEAITGTVTVINDVTERVAREQELQQLLVQERQARAEVERAVGRVERLLAITAALSSAPTPVEIARVIVGQGGAALGAHAGLIARLSADQSDLEIVHAHGYPTPTIADWRKLPLEIPSPLTVAVLRQEEVLVESYQELAVRYPLLLATSDAIGTRSLAAVPLVAYGRAIGVLGLSFAVDQPLGAEDRAFLRALAHQGAQALERARLFEAEHEARARAEAAVRVRDQFLSIAAHEFRTPLTSLLGNAQLLQRRMQKEGSLPERHQRLLHVTIDQGQRLSRMVSTMLDVSRLETGRFALERKPLNLDALLLRVVEELQATSARHALSYHGLGRPITVDGDELRLEQVFYNLLANAIKYSPKGGPVTVEAASRSGQVAVAITDRGMGIPAEDLPQLFQQFFRAPNVDEHRIGGVGIGLYIVREIVERHQGTIAASSDGVRGSTFTVRLPRRFDAG
jgi:signal transduction histidine kinase